MNKNYLAFLLSSGSSQAAAAIAAVEIAAAAVAVDIAAPHPTDVAVASITGVVETEGIGLE